MADEHGVHDRGVHENGASEIADTDPGAALEPTAVHPAPPAVPDPRTSGELVAVGAPAPRVPKPDVKNSVVLIFAACIIVFVGISAVSIWAASRLDGGVPGITAPAKGHREAPVFPPDERNDGAIPGTGQAPDTGQPAGGAQPRGAAPDAGRVDPVAAKPLADVAVDWSAVDYGLDCAGLPTEVRANVPLPGGVHLLQVRCATGAGTPPDAIIAYTLGDDGRPDRGRTLLDTADDRIVKSLDVADGHATATLLGWSGENVPRCCPDQEETLQLIP
ncbi:hypothetical protein [Yinghuangia aomiensis]|uniref:hypothetical protein n=1 Tax=Yinghuangia aomiensis TaxID=676205 RepID=UPI0031EF7F42